MKKTKKNTFANLPTTYEELAKLHMPRPIHDEVGYDNAMELIDVLAGHKLNTDQDDYLMILTDMVESYENETAPDEPEASGADVLKYLMEEHSMTGDDLAQVLEVDRSLAYRILKGERNLTTAHIKALAAHFGVSPATFID